MRSYITVVEAYARLLQTAHPSVSRGAMCKTSVSYNSDLNELYCSRFGVSHWLNS